MKSSPIKKRIRFSTRAERVGLVDIDIVHKVNDNTIDECFSAEPSKASKGCLFFDQLQHWRELDISKSFKRFQYVITPMVQSLPELLHHQVDIVEVILDQLKVVEVDDCESYISLISVLARDLQEDIGAHFDKLSLAIINLINRASKVSNVNIEVIGKIFKCYSYLLKYQSSLLIKNPSKLKKYYAKLLGHRIEYIRDFSAKSFNIIIRRIRPKVFKNHVNSFFNSILKKCTQININFETCNINFSVNDLLNYLPNQLVDLINGVALLLFYSIKGLKGSIHSEGPVKIRCLFELLLPLFHNNDSTNVISYDKKTIKMVGCVLSYLIPKLYYYIYPNNSKVLWDEMIGLIQNCLDCYDNNKSEFENVLNSISISMDMIYYALEHSNSRALRDKNVKKEISNNLITSCVNLIQKLLCDSLVTDYSVICRCHKLFCKLWILFNNNLYLKNSIENVSKIIIAYNNNSDNGEFHSGLSNILENLLPFLEIEVVNKHLTRNIIMSCVNLLSNPSSNELMNKKLLIIYRVFVFFNDVRKSVINYSNNENTDFAYDNADDDWEYNDSDEDIEEESVNGKSDNKYLKKSTIKQFEKDSYSYAHYINEIMIIYDTCFTLLHQYFASIEPFHYELLYLSSKCLIWIENFVDTKMNKVNVKDRMNSIYKNILSKDTFINNIEDLYIVSNTLELLYIYYSKDDSNTDLLHNILSLSVTIFVNSSVSFQMTEVLLNIIDRNYKQSNLSIKSNFLSTAINNCDLYDKLIDKITNSLTSPSFWIRLSLLQILSYDNVAELNKIDNNEENTFIDIIEILLQIMTIKIGLVTEREFTRLMSKIELLILNNRLPEKFVKIIFSFCIGLFNIKFKPYWVIISNVLVAASSNIKAEDLLWPILQKALESLSDCIINLPIEQSIFSYFCQRDDGSVMIELNSNNSVLFPYIFTDANQGQVYPDSRSDSESVYLSLWSILKKIPSITLRKSKSVVPMFLKFLSNQYYDLLTDDVNIPIMKQLGVISNDIIPNKTHNYVNIKMVKKRLELYLSVFAAVSSPLQLYQNQLLYHIYLNLLSLSDLEIVKLSYACILTYKSNYLLPYKDNIYNILDDKLIRNELLSFNISNAVDSSHRECFIVILIRIIYGRLFSKKNYGKLCKDESTARRNAILLYLSQFTSNELSLFLYLICRGIIPQEKVNLIEINYKVNSNISLDDSIVNVYSDYCKNVNKIILELQSNDFISIAWERQIGFLFLLEQLIKINGFQIVESLSYIISLVSNLLQNAISYRRNFNSFHEEMNEVIDDDVDNNINDKGDDNNSHEIMNDRSEYVNKKNSLKVRNLCILRLSELVYQYHNVFSFTNSVNDVLISLNDIVMNLPTSLNNRKPPALLKLICTLISFEETISVLTTNLYVVDVLINCLALKSSIDITKILYHAFISLIDYNSSIYIIDKIDLLVESFAKRFGYTMMQNTQEIRLSDLSISPSGSIKLELSLLYHLSNTLFHRDDIIIQSVTISNLATLLLGMLRTYTTNKKIKADEEWVVQILSVYKSIIFRLNDVNIHIPFISRLFGPASHSLNLFNNSNIRNILVDIFIELSNHTSCFHGVKNSAVALSNIVAMDKRILDSRDYDKCMTVFQDLSDQNDSSSQTFHWSNILGPNICSNTWEISMCLVIVFECIRSMYDKEIIIRNAALSSLKCLIGCIAKWCNISQDNYDIEIDNNNDRINIVINTIIPSINIGLKNSSDSIMKGFVQLLSFIIHTIGSTPYGQIQTNKSIFYSDLLFLLNEDLEQDFFENIFHIQIHRRLRALIKLRNQLLDSDCSIQVRSFINVLVPIALHPIMSDEYTKKDHQYMLDASNLLGAIAKYLPWSHYYKLLKNLLKKLERNNINKEKALINSLCNVLDSFHFDMSMSKEETNDLENNEDDDEVDNRIEENENIKSNEDNKSNINEIVNVEEETNEVIIKDMKSSNISEIMFSSIYPWVKSFLLKDEIDQHGNKTKSIRTQIALTLIKIINHFSLPIVTEERKHGMFMNIVITVVNTLKSRDISIRDIARDSLGKIVLTMGLSTLPSIIYELQFVLKEGYQRHICSYTIRNILTTVLQDYAPPIDATTLLHLMNNSNQNTDDITIEIPIFDKCIPLLMPIIIDDLIGETQIDRDVETANRTLIREAKGIKCYDILEIIGKCMLFRPTYVIKDLSNPTKVSSIHAVTNPLLQITINNNDRKDVLNRVAEALTRLTNGLVNNTSVLPEELLVYIQATIQPFVSLAIKEYDLHKESLGKINQNYNISEGICIDNKELNDEFDALPSYLREDSSDEEDLVIYSSTTTKRQKIDKNNNVVGYKPTTWFTSESNMLQTQRDVIKQRDIDRKALITVQDGASAPKLTGINRYDEGFRNKKSKVSNYKSNEGVIHAMNFCLTLLLSALKKKSFDLNNVKTKSILQSLCILLGHCLRLSSATTMICLCIRCLTHLLSFDLNIDSILTQAIGSRLLKLMFKGGILITSDNEIVQVCMKGLITLFKSYNNKISNQLNNKKLPLIESKIRLLLQLLTNSIMEITSNYQNTAFTLIKSIIETRLLLPEIYDLINKLFEQLVISQRLTIRESSSMIIIEFLIHYPLSKKRFSEHLKQLILNCSYEYEDGRLSALSTLLYLLKVIPLPILYEHIDLIFLSIAVRLVNDISIKCIDIINNIIINLFKRLEYDYCNKLFEYTIRWIDIDIFDNTDESKGLLRTGIQILKLIIDSKSDVIKKSKHFNNILISIHHHLLIYLIKSGEISWINKQQKDNNSYENEVTIQNNEGDSVYIENYNWYMIYHLLKCIESCFIHLSNFIEYNIYNLPIISMNISNKIYDIYGITIPIISDTHSVRLFDLIQETLLYPHLWVRSVSCRIINLYLSKRNCKDIIQSSSFKQQDYLLYPNALFQLARRLCIVINQPFLTDQLLENVKTMIVFVIRAMYYHPQLYHPELNNNNELIQEMKDNNETDEEDNSNEMIKDNTDNIIISSEDEDKDSNMNSGANWIMQRLKNIGSDRRGLRRLFIVQIFKELIDLEELEFIYKHINQILEVAIRIELTINGPDMNNLMKIKESTLLLTNSIEQKLGSNNYIKYYSNIQKKLQSNRLEKKRKYAIEAVIDPVAFASKKLNKRKKNGKNENIKKSLKDLAIYRGEDDKNNTRKKTKRN